MNFQLLLQPDSVSAELASNKTTAVSTDPSEKAFEQGRVTLAFSMLKMTAPPDSLNTLWMKTYDISGKYQ